MSLFCGDNSRKENQAKWQRICLLSLHEKERTVPRKTLYPCAFLKCGVCWKKSELILNKIPTDCRAKLGRTETERSGGQKGRGLGGRNFCPPSLSPLLFSPPQFFVFRFAKCAVRMEVVFAPPTRAHTTVLLPLFCLPNLL